MTSSNSRRSVLRSALAVGGVAVSATAVSAGDATAVAADAGWVNVKDHGAKGDGTTDDTAAIQAALDACRPGNVTVLPAGVYRTSAPLRIGPYVTLQGSHAGGESQPGAQNPVAGLRPLPSFTGHAVVEILDQQLGGYSIQANAQRVFSLSIDGSDLPRGGAEIDGIRATGQIQHLQLRDVHVRAVTGVGINTWYNFDATGGPQAPFCLHYDRISVLWTGSHGIVLNNSTDSVFHDVYVLGVGGCGWWMSGAGNSSFTSCRAEWSSKHGFDIESVPGVIKMVACSTDRNGWHGMYVHATDTTGVLLLSAVQLTRDGKNAGSGGGGYAGLGVASSLCKVIADGLVVLTGKDDDGAGVMSPQYGVRADYSAYVVVNSGHLQGVTSPWQSGSGNTKFVKGTLVGTG